MRYDVIILSYALNSKMAGVTMDCIKSLKLAEDAVKFDILVLESGQDIKFDGAKTIFYKEKEFCYNRSLNYGISITNNPYILCCNNDLFFHRGFAENLYNAFAMGYKSLSPYCSYSHPRHFRKGDYLATGLQVGVHVAGWCIAVEREMIKSIGGFNEQVDFWYSDNIYADQLRKNKIQHALVCNAYVDHIGLGSQTLSKLDRNKSLQLTRYQRKKYIEGVMMLYAEKKESHNKVS